MTGKPSGVTAAILDMADDMRRLGIMPAEAHEKITLRHMGDAPTAAMQPITGAEIRALREEACLSQAVFARYLNLTVGYVSQIERGAKKPKGPALALLNIIRRKGVETIF
jgi:putative transcriptional regulator